MTQPHEPQQPEPQRNNFDELDTATARRLAQFSERLIDVTRLAQQLDQQLESQIVPLLDPDAPMTRIHADKRAADDVPLTFRISRWFTVKTLASLAATLTIVTTLFIVLSTNPPQATARTFNLSQLHHDLIQGRFPIAPAATIADVNAALAQQQNTTPALPHALSNESPNILNNLQIQSCCLANVQGRLVAVAVLQLSQDNPPTTAPITLVVTDAPDFAHRMGQTITIDNREYFGHQLNNTRMMMANHNDRWLCVMGDPDQTTDQSLAQIASQITF